MTPDDIERLIEAARRAGVTVVEVDAADLSLRLRLSPAATPAAADGPAPRPGDPAPVDVRSPGVGIFRPRHPFTGRPACEPGAAVEAGQVVGFLETGVSLRALEAPQAGIVGAPLRDDGAVVGYGTPLYRIAPGGKPGGTSVEPSGR